MEVRKITFSLIAVLLPLWITSSAYSTRTRDEIINEAQAYKNLNWTCYNTYEYNGQVIFESGHSYTGEAYWSHWNGWDTRPTFIDKVEVQHLKPRAEAGIDCSGLVSRCWDVNRNGGKYNTNTIEEISTQIEKSQLELTGYTPQLSTRAIFFREQIYETLFFDRLQTIY